LVDWLSALVRAFGTVLGQPMLMATDLRMHNFAVFGVALLLATLPRARQLPQASSATAQDAAWSHTAVEA
jgi:hypothetical protein